MLLGLYSSCPPPPTSLSLSLYLSLYLSLSLTLSLSLSISCSLASLSLCCLYHSPLPSLRISFSTSTPFFFACVKRNEFTQTNSPTSLLHQKPNITAQEIEDNFDGNICRCTGYRPILDAMKSFAGDANIPNRKTIDIEVRPRATVGLKQVAV